ncbi:hypothetical protein BVY02_02210 [bacterium J17]|nr:hypothetical protein BVY02_02210 [bacterium J17]
MENIKDMVDRFVEDGVMTREEHDEFVEAMHKDGDIDEEEKAEITRIFTLIREGKLKIVDPEREASEKRKAEDGINLNPPTIDGEEESTEEDSEEASEDNQEEG